MKKTLTILSVAAFLSSNLIAEKNKTTTPKPETSNKEVKQAKEMFDLERVFLGKNSFMGQGKIEFIKGEDSLVIPIVIVSRVKKVEKLPKEKIKIDTEVTLEIKPRKGKNKSALTKINAIVDKNMNTLEYIETNIDDKKEIVINCKNENPQFKNENDFKFPIGYKSPTETLTCDDGSVREAKWELKNSGKKGLAKIYLTRNISAKQNGKDIKGSEETTLLIDKDGNILEIKSKSDINNKMKINYYSQDILQKN